MFKPTTRFFSQLRKTPLYDLHVKLQGKMVEYAGFSMPVLYKTQSHVDSHNWVRENAGLFDVSHMVQHRIEGPDARKLLENVTPSDLKSLKPFHSTLSVLLNRNGGIIDDTIITKHDENSFYVVTNAGCRDKDLQFLKSSAHGLDLKHSQLKGGLLALQGPHAAQSLQKLTKEDLSKIYFGQSKYIPLGNLTKNHVYISRGGYTGEDGFEISIENDEESVSVAEALLDMDVVKPIGLAARDSLRLEAGMCLYGHELSEQINPVEARLSWTIGKRRKLKGDFNGANNILRALENKEGPLRCGLVSSGPAPRHGMDVCDEKGNKISEVTSGSLSPTLKANVSMTYLPRELAKVGSTVYVSMRGKLRPATVSKMPFVPVHYYKQG